MNANITDTSIYFIGNGRPKQPAVVTAVYGDLLN